MKVRFLNNTYIRVSPDEEHEPLGVIYRDTFLEMQGKVTGAELQWISTWYRDPHGWYFWGGAVEEVPEDAPEETDHKEDPGFSGEEEPTLKAPTEGPIPDSPSSKVEYQTEEQPEKEPACDPEEGEDSYPTTEDGADEYQMKKEESDPDAPPEPIDYPTTDTSEDSPEDESYVPEKVADGWKTPPPPEGPAYPYPLSDRYQRKRTDRIEFDADRMNWGIEDLEIRHFYWNNCNVQGEGVKVAILDTGIDSNHPDLSDAVAGGCNFVGEDSSDYSDEDGHGTQVAGLIAGRGQEYVWGVAPQAELFIGKIMETYASFDFETLLKGIDWALDQRVDVILTSVDFRKSDLSKEEQKVLERKVREVVDRGALLVAPAGNSDSAYPQGRYPASLENCFSVGAFDREGKRQERSIRSFTLDALAPGADLLTAAAGGGTQNDFTGTDAAAAFAAGVVALLFNLLNDRSLPWKGPDVLTLIRETAVPRFAGNDLRDFEYGYGLINPAAALEAVLKGGASLRKGMEQGV